MNAVWPLFSPQSVFGMRREDEYSIAVQSVDETEVLARDVPLCSFEQVKRGVEQLIESGHVRRIFDARLGLVVYNDPDRDKKARSTFDLNYYLAPAWVVNCIYMDSSKAEFAYGAVPADELVRDEKNVPEYCPIILNAQTGEPLNRADKGGDSRADFKGFISWDDVK